MNPRDLKSDAARECLLEAESAARKAAVDHASAIAVERAVRQACKRFDAEYRSSLRHTETLTRQLDDARAQLRGRMSDPESDYRVLVETLCGLVGVEYDDSEDGRTIEQQAEQALIALTERMAEPETEAIPVAELAKVLGCDADAASVRMRLEDITSEEDGPQPDADGWHAHDGKSWPACGISDEVEVSLRDGRITQCQPRHCRWDHRDDFDDIIAWRHTDGPDRLRDEPRAGITGLECEDING